MITSYQDYLNEAAEETKRSQAVGLEEALDILKARCPNFGFASPLFYRGRKGDVGTGCFLVDPTGVMRPSRDNSNHLNLLLDNLAAWAPYPKRQHSVIFTNSGADSYTFGEPYYLFPLDGAKVAVAPERDILYSFEYMEEELGCSPSILLSRFESGRYKVSDTSWLAFSMEMDKLFDAVSLKDRETYSTSTLLQMFADFKTANRTWQQELGRLLSPGNNGFHVTKYDGQFLSGEDNRVSSDYHSNFTIVDDVGPAMPEADSRLKHAFTHQEMWTDSPCLMIHYTMAKQIAERYV